MGDKCQQNSFGGGIRPFGAEIVVCGTDPEGSLVVYVTQPSGAILGYTRPSLEHGKVVGGNSKKRERLQTILKEKVKNLEKDDCSKDGEEHSDDSAVGLIRERIRLVVQAMLDLYQDEEKDQVDNLLNEIDIVIAHSSQGIFRMNGDMLRKILVDDA